MARYEGDGSYYKLLVEIYGKNITGIVNNSTEADSGIKSLPLSFVRSGFYTHSNGNATNRHDYGLYWEPHAARFGNDFYGYYLSFRGAHIVPQTNYDVGRGDSLRCAAQVGNIS